MRLQRRGEEEGNKEEGKSKEENDYKVGKNCIRAEQSNIEKIRKKKSIQQPSPHFLTSFSPLFIFHPFPNMLFPHPQAGSQTQAAPS